MKILLITGSLNQGGAEFQLISLARLLQSKGHDIEVIALTDYDYFLPYIREHKIKYSCVSNNGNSLQRLARAVQKIKSAKPALVISYIKRVSQVAILARIMSGFGFKLIISERTSLIKPWHDQYYFNLALLANKITVNSISKIDYLKRSFPTLSKRAVFIPNIIDVKRFKCVERVNTESNLLRIAFIGRVSPEKNILNLIKAIELVRKTGANLRLSINGAASNKIYLEQVNNLIKILSVEDSVKYEGPTKDIISIYKNTDLLCLVSFFEGFSNVLSEAIACGVPVVASNISENLFLVKDGENGFLIEPGDAESIASGIKKFMRLSQVEIDTISDNNRKKAEAIFNEEKIYQRYAELFVELGIV